MRTTRPARTPCPSRRPGVSITRAFALGLALSLLAPPSALSQSQRVPLEPQAEAQPAEQDPLAREVTRFLDASARLAGVLIRLDESGGPALQGEPAQRELAGIVHGLAHWRYPTRDPATLDARRKILAAGRLAVPHLIEARRACNPEEAHGLTRAGFADQVLVELAGGDCVTAGVQGLRVGAANWDALWARTANDPDFWSGARGSAVASAAAVAPLAELGFVPVEFVLGPGMRLRVRTGSGAVEIASLGGFERSYAWEGEQRTAWLGEHDFVQTHERQHRPYAESCKALRATSEDVAWEPNAGIDDAALEEGQLHFERVEDALAWIAEWRKRGPLVYSRDGYAVSWEETLEEKFLYVGVWRIVIAGREVADLPGSNDEAIALLR